MTNERLAELLRIDIEQAAQVRGIIKGELNPQDYKSVQSWVSQCYNMPSKLELKLCAINEIIGGYGVEYINHVDDSLNDVLGIDYINLGDTYTTTVCYDHDLSKFVYTSWGDIVEGSPDTYA
jgi:hypothetical protein